MYLRESGEICLGWVKVALFCFVLICSDLFCFVYDLVRGLECTETDGHT